MDLEAELGTEVAARFRAARRAAAARDVQLEALATAVGAVAAERKIPVALLKYGALRAAGVLPTAARLAADIDLLVREDDAPALHDALLARGWQPGGLPGWEHHLPALVHPRLGELEIHDRLPGLCRPHRQPDARLESNPEPAGAFSGAVGYDDLAEEDALASGRWGETLRVPVRPVLLAHALVHGLVQHGWAPRSYPPWRGVSDWVDLGLGTSDGASLLAATTPWLGDVLSRDETEAARRLCVLLTAGRPEALEEETAAAALGRHLLAGPLDPAYRRALRLGRLRAVPGAGHRPGPRRGGDSGRASLGSTLWRTVARAVAPPRSELAALYGPWRSGWGLAWRRLVRPADLALRVLTATAGRLRRRWGRPVRL